MHSCLLNEEGRGICEDTYVLLVMISSYFVTFQMVTMTDAVIFPVTVMVTVTASVTLPQNMTVTVTIPLRKPLW
jgi:hypothetical protein